MPVYTEDEVEMYNIGSVEKEKDIQEKILKPDLPQDPRHWSRADVCDWVIWMCSNHHLPNPDIDRSVGAFGPVFTFHIYKLDRFLMNGKAVCLMSVQMFSNRVPLGGKLLYRDFQIRLAKALYKK